MPNQPGSTAVEISKPDKRLFPRHRITKAPAVAWLEHHRVSRLLGAGLVLLTILSVAGATAYALRRDASQIVKTVPAALERGRDRLISQLGISQAPAEQSGGEDRAANEAGDNQLDAANRSTGTLVQRVVAAAISFAGDLVVIVFLTYFLLISGRRLRNRLIEIAGPDPDRRGTTATIIDEINNQIQRYLLVLLVTAVIVGVATWIALAWMKVPNAAMWGALAGLFNSIPYFGPVVVSGGLFAVGLAQGGGFTQALQMSGAAIVITSLEGWLLTPTLMGRAERMNALAVFLGLLLWTWVWGPWGTVLAVPMLVIIKSVADRVERLRPIGRLMAP